MRVEAIRGRYHVIRFVSVAISLVIISLASLPAEAGQESSSELVLRQHIVSFLQSGSRLDGIPTSHPLSPLGSTRIVATTAYLLMKNDPSMLKTFYPKVSNIVTKRFKRDKITTEGLLLGSIDAEGDATDISLSPTLNALANLELYSLHLIAASIGEHEDAIEYLSWSRGLADIITRRFYDPTRDCFFPISRSGHMLIRYSPGQLLPLLLDRSFGRSTRYRIVEKFLTRDKIIAQKRGLGTGLMGLREDPRLGPVLIDLLSHIPRIRETIIDMSSFTSPTVTPNPWTRFWDETPSIKKVLFPAWAEISFTIHLARILERESLLEPNDIRQLKNDTNVLLQAISRKSIDLDSYRKTIATVNRLLMNISDINSQVSFGASQLKSIDSYVWNRLSPRTKRLIGEASTESLEELRSVKVTLTDRLGRAAGIISEIRFPERPIPLGTKVAFTASLRGIADSLTISRLYLQVGEQRWKVTGDGETITLAPGLRPFIYNGDLPLSPTAQPGIVELPLYFDFLLEGRRTELHAKESIALIKGYDISLSFPAGQKLTGLPIPVHITVRYRPDHNMQGTVDGTFLRELQCSPELPAKFIVKKGATVTTLPLEIRTKDIPSPGRYPFSITVSLERKQVAVFEESLVKPIRWFSLGPMEQSGWVLENGVRYQDDLFKTYPTAEGGEIHWQEVPAGTIDGEGAVVPMRLYGNVSNRCCLLYTVIDAPPRMKIKWRLETRNTSSLWINGEPVFLAGAALSEDVPRVIDMRKGINSILIACCWEKSPDRILFSIMDEGGLPASGMNNEIDKIVEGFERLVHVVDREQLPSGVDDRLRNITLTLDYPEASDVCVIGTFNNWESGATPMKLDRDGSWIAQLVLPPGRYAYKFLIDKKIKITDPASTLVEPDGFGGMNSILEVR